MKAPSCLRFAVSSWIPTLLSLALCLAPAGCGPRQPPKLPVPTVQPIEVPMPAPPPPSDAPLFAYLKVRDLTGTMGLFGGAATLGPLAQAQGVSLDEIAAGKPLSLFLWDPDRVDSPFALPLVGLFPVPAQGTVARRLTSMHDSLQAEAWGEQTSIAMNGQALDRARAQKDTLLGLSGAPTPFDALLYVHIDAVLSKYAPVLRQGIRAMQPLLMMTAARQPGSPSPASTMAMFEGLVTSLEALRAAALGVRPYDGGVELSALVQDKAAKPGDKGPIAAANLAQFLPAGDVKLVWNTRDIQRMVDFYMRLYGPMLDEQPQLRTVVQGMVDEWVKLGRKMEMAVSFTLGGDKAFRAYGLMRVDSPAAMLALGRKTVGLMQQGPVHDAYARLGVDLQLTGKQGVRKVQGWPVDRYEYKSVLTPAAQNSPAKPFWEKLTGMSYEVAQVGPYVVYALNAPVDDVVKALFKGPVAGSPGMQALSAYPAGGSFYADINFSSLFKGMAALVPAELAGRMPSLPPEAGPLLLFGYDAGEVGYYRARIPMTLILALKTASEGLRLPTPPIGGPRSLPGAPPL